MMRTHVLNAALAMLITATIPSANAQEPSTATVGVRAHVRLICRASFMAPPTIQTDGIRLGPLEQLCNGADGFQLVFYHPRSLDGSRLLIDGVPVRLSGERTIVIDSHQPAYRLSEVKLETPSSVEPSQLSFRMEPRGGSI
jgi:hypothetical protein